MSSYLTPGVYIEEIPSGARPVEGVPTSITAFVGTPYRGPANEALFIGSWDDYVSQFSDPTSSSGVNNDTDSAGNLTDTMALAVRAFFQNGGQQAYICRVTSTNPTSPAAASVTLGDGTNDVLTVTATSEGDWAEDLYVLIENTPLSGTFSLSIGTRDGDDFTAIAGEVFNDVSMTPSDDNFVEKAINGGSRLVNVAIEEGATNGPEDNNTDTTPGAQLTGGEAADPDAGDYTSFYDSKLRKVRDFSIMVLPGRYWTQDATAADSGNEYINNTLAFCERHGRAVLIVDPPRDTELDSSTDVTNLVLPTSTYSALYYPWVTVRNPIHDPDKNPTAPSTIHIQPSSIAAGLWTQTDGRRGVWKAPAGVEARVSAAGLQYNAEDLEQSFLNPLGVNCIRNRAGYGRVVWGARTLATKASPEWRYVPVRRTAIFIEQSIYNGIQWAVFEPNADPLWSSLRVNIGSFMNSLFRAGAFQGTTANDAYFVRCGLGDTMTQGDIDRGQVIIIVGFAPVKPAEFVILRIQQKVNQQ
ncbi:phage tail sheath family protein [Halomonas urumqiensis]|uniref:Phage tail protein n=1 Tax=Halomonas urumqiensis TaxID=1684789 RepID=A0A2N7UCW2_9GAMM|nr:phage tail sheath C-terminal domain-containing protein [Halomonas urumqiensis]PMR78296.1 phage tail protein [Halomonas urumqiensis]PTB03443.1 phage tail sheath family protein [Halomonas urumqiensis]GHE20375.1 tail protein [Halomonas urumqiensis]